MRATRRADCRRTHTISAIQPEIGPRARDSDLIFSLDAISQTVFASMKSPCGLARGQRQTSLASRRKVDSGLHDGSTSVAEAGLFALPTIGIWPCAARNCFFLQYPASVPYEVSPGC